MRVCLCVCFVYSYAACFELDAVFCIQSVFLLAKIAQWQMWNSVVLKLFHYISLEHLYVQIKWYSRTNYIPFPMSIVFLFCVVHLNMWRFQGLPTLKISVPHTRLLRSFHGTLLSHSCILSICLSLTYPPINIVFQYYLYFLTF